jgi:transcriptional regulator GlxA family with amidase domain
MGIKQYINSLRVENAKNLLENSSLSVTEIAFSLGFSSPNYFTQIFKSNTGMSPASYKQNARKKHSKV